LGNTPLGEGGRFPVQQTASLSGAGAVLGRSLFLKTARAANISGKKSARLLRTSQPEMNANQVIRPEIEPNIIGGNGGQPGLVKIRRKLGLTFVLSNPFRVPVAQSPAGRDAPETDAAKKAKLESI
jgi:hypothetical protein